MHVVVDRDLGESIGLGVAACSYVFQLDNHDRLVLLIEGPTESLRAAVERAVTLCPRQALALEERE